MNLRRILVLTMVFLFTALLSAHASVKLTMYDGADNPTGALSAAPNSTVGWGIQFVNDSSDYWASITGSEFIFDSINSESGYDLRTLPTLDAYTDFVAGLNVILAPNQTSAIYHYNPSSLSGAGSIAIGDYQSGLTMFGTISTSYDYFSKAPVDGGFNSGDWVEPGGLTATVNASVTTVPEPSTYALLCLSMGVVGFARKKMGEQC